MADISVRQLLQAWAIGDNPGSRTIDIRGENRLRAIANTLGQAASMDLVWIEQDDNGLPKNPRWGFQARNPGQLPDVRTLCPGDLHHPGSDCTTQATFIDSWSLCPHEGHVNWFPCTYEGKIYFDGYSRASKNFQDYDYNWLLDTPNQAGVTASNEVLDDRRMLQLEFDTRETINHFTTPWWDSFHKAVDRGVSEGNKNDAMAMVNGRFAIVTGLIGLDCSHVCACESHPVYAMAIHVNDDPLDDTWAIFVRNWGNEGFCSDSHHGFGFLNDMYTFRLPWRPSAQSVTNKDSPFNTNNDALLGPSVMPIPGKAVLVSFQLPNGALHPWANGELHLQWVGGSSAPMHPVPPGAQSTARVSGDEDLLHRFTARMTPAQLDAFSNALPGIEMPDPPTDVPTQDMPTRPLVNPPVRRVPPRLGIESLRVQSVVDPDKAEFDRRTEEHMRTAFGGTIPDLLGE